MIVLQIQNKKEQIIFIITLRYHYSCLDYGLFIEMETGECNCNTTTFIRKQTLTPKKQNFHVPKKIDKDLIIHAYYMINLCCVIKVGTRGMLKEQRGTEPKSRSCQIKDQKIILQLVAPNYY